MFRQLVAIALFGASLCGIASAQSGQARIVGTVTDSKGAVIPRASVTAKNERTGVERTAAANGLGYYVIANLAPDQYAVKASAPDLGAVEFTNVVLGAGQERTIDITMHPASLQQEVTVSAGDLVVIDLSSARIGSNISQREVATLPLNGRQLSQLYLLTPGAVNNGSGTYDNIRFSGRSNQENALRFDGIEGSSIIDASPGNLNGEQTSTFRLQSSLENVQEFRVESSNYPAEYGTGTGGQISIITKSGSNQFHGALFEYVRNSAFDARNFFDKTSDPSPLRVNQFGGSAGGPIQKDKFFFFASYEGLRQRAGMNFIELVPSAAARARAVPSIQPLLAAYPAGSQASPNPNFDLAYLNSSAKTNENTGSMRLDYRFNDKYTLYMRYQRDQGESYLPLGVTGNALRVNAVPQNGLINFQQVLRPNLINETKFGVNANKTNGFGTSPAVPGVDMGSISVNMSGSVALSGIAGQGGSAGVATPGALVRSNSASNGRGQPYTNYSLSFIDSLSWIQGQHNAKFGVEVRPIRLFTDRLGGTTYTFSNVDDFLANKPSSVQFLGDVSAPSPFNGGATGRREGITAVYSGYAQDEWKLKPTLTMTYGLRYEFYPTMREARNLDVVFNEVTGQIMPPDTTFYHSKKTNFGPRLAFAWAPQRFQGSTVFRIGAGYYYGPGQTEDQIQPIESDRVSRTLAAGTLYPIDPAQIIATYNINDPSLGFQPRAYSRGYTIPEKILSYTASLQQKLPGDAVLTVAYVGSQGRNLFLRSWTNKIVSVGMNPTTGAAIVNREFGNRFAEIDYKTSGGTDNYNSLQTTLNRRFSKGFTLGAQYTWGHTIGNTSGSNEARTSQNPFDFSTERSNNNFDVRQSFNLNALYELPFGKGRKYAANLGSAADAVIGGWELGGVVNARSGVPIEVGITRPDVIYQDTTTGQYYTSPVLVNNVPVTVPVINTPAGGSSRNIRRPDVVPGVDPYLHVGRLTFINPAAFSMPQPGTYGNLARNALQGPGLAQVDLTLHKRFPITEKTNVEFRSEIYNILNRANFGNPPSSLANALPSKPGLANTIQPGQAFSPVTAGGIFGTLNSSVERQVGLGTSRQIQLSLRLNF